MLICTRCREIKHHLASKAVALLCIIGGFHACIHYTLLMVSNAAGVMSQLHSAMLAGGRVNCKCSRNPRNYFPVLLSIK